MVALGPLLFVLGAGVFVVLCVATLHLGLKAREARRGAGRAEHAAALERDRRERADGLADVLGGALCALDVESALGAIAEAARANRTEEIESDRLLKAALGRVTA